MYLLIVYNYKIDTIVKRELKLFKKSSTKVLLKLNSLLLCYIYFMLEYL